MFGESESESPRVPSPWDSLISTPPSPSRSSSTSPSPLSIELIPRLVPEADEGNVEYKLQLLSPSPARFARLVTQLKWRLLEGGGQAYYELGVADSGALVGLPRAELEQSLETLEMMAGEIGASVIVVKEIEVPAVMAGLAASQTDKWNGERKRRVAPPGSEGSRSPTAVLTSLSTTETETEPSTTDIDDEDIEGMSSTVVLNGKRTSNAPYPILTHSSSQVSLFLMDPDPDLADNADAEPASQKIQQQQPYFAIDLEIASVFKPRPMRARMQMHAHSHTVGGPAKTKRLQRIKHITHPNSTSDSEQHTQEYARAKGKGHAREAPDPVTKANTRRQVRDRKREEKRKALLAYAEASTAAAAFEPPDSPTFSASPSPGPVPFPAEEKLPSNPTPAETSALVSGLASLHVSLDEPVPSSYPNASTSPKVIPITGLKDDQEEDDDDDNVFATPLATAMPAVSTSGSKEDGTETGGAGAGPAQSRLIVEALVVRKMSLDEAFLDFGGFALV